MYAMAIIMRLSAVTQDDRVTIIVKNEIFIYTNKWFKKFEIQTSNSYVIQRKILIFLAMNKLVRALPITNTYCNSTIYYTILE